MPEYKSLQCLQILCNKQKFKNQREKEKTVQHFGGKDIDEHECNFLPSFLHLANLA